AARTSAADLRHRVMRRTTRAGPHRTAGGCLCPLGGTIRPRRYDDRALTERIAPRGIVSLDPSRSPGQALATRVHDVRIRLTLFATLVIAVAVLVAGCAGAAAPPDPYEQLTASTKAAWSPIQVNIGVKVTALGKTVTLDPKDIAMV